MALISCPECSRAISDSALACPHCGKPAAVKAAAPTIAAMAGQAASAHAPPKNGCGTLLMIFILLPLFLAGGCVLLLAGLGGVKRAGLVATPTPRALSADEQRLGMKPGYCPGRYLKSVGALRGEDAPPCVVELLLSRTLNDPGSFKMDSLCKVSAGDSAWIASCTYRAKNAFGGYVLQTTEFHIRNGQIVDVKNLSGS